ncbi:MAG: hypothetical protein AAGA96_09000, partial [Verrucomicrobiota bacterium]
MNIEVGPPDEVTSYRKIAIASWRHPRDPTTYSWIDVPIEPAEAYLKSVDAEVAPTLTHFLALALADCLKRQPEFDRFLRAGKLYPRLSTDAFITTLLRGKKGKDLSGFVIREIVSKSLAEVAKESAEETDKLRKGEDKEMEETQRRVNLLPAELLRVAMWFQELIAYRLNLNPRWVGMPKDRFGSFMISNIGALGLERAFIPLSPYTRCPIIIGLGKPRGSGCGATPRALPARSGATARTLRRGRTRSLGISASLSLPLSFGVEVPRARSGERA